MTDKEIEQEIQAKGKTAPRVTPERIEEVISSEFYFTAGEGVLGASAMGTKPAGKADSLNRLTYCVLVLQNGYTVTGESACVSSANFDPEIGKKIARQKAVDKIWELEGYLLRQKLYEQSFEQVQQLQTDIPPHQLRVLEELSQLSERLTKLSAFINGAGKIFSALSAEEQNRLRKQEAFMREYQSILAERIANF